MTPYQFRLNRYIERMAKDMTSRNMTQSTIDAYTWHVTKFCEFFDSPPEKLGPEEKARRTVRAGQSMCCVI